MIECFKLKQSDHKGHFDPINNIEEQILVIWGLRRRLLI